MGRMNAGFHPHRMGIELYNDPSSPDATSSARAAVHAPRADLVEVCLFDGKPGDPLTGERRVKLEQQTHGTWHGPVQGVRAGQRYGLRVHGPWDPAAGLRFNSNKLLLDPYAKAITGEITWGPELFGHAVDDDWTPVDGPAAYGGARVRDERNNAGMLPVGVIMPRMATSLSPRPQTPFSRTVVYEAHLKGLTAQHPLVPPELRGTWAGLAHPVIIEHLLTLGVTAVELLPVFAKSPEPFLVKQGRENYWGYNHLSFFAPDPALVTARARAAGPAAVCSEVVAAIDALHNSGLEVILDVVYNHTCEGGPDGPTMSWRGLGEGDYYRVDEHGNYIDMTGCGNTMNFAQPAVYGMALQSMRHWVRAYGVDGFRFDLAPVLGRGDHRFSRDGYDPNRSFFAAVRSDPELSGVKLIAEPWDVGHGGWRTGQFPPPFAEWNDRYRDTFRKFWVADQGALAHDQHGRTPLRDVATRLAGSADHFAVAASVDHVRRPAWASVNFVTAHDGFTMADLVAYNHKHNQANGEQNRDGTDNNNSWNHGTEGATDDPTVLAERHRTTLALLSTMAFSVGVPMFVAGDEQANTQTGNNNPYSLNSPVTWLNWSRLTDPAQDDLDAETLTAKATYEALTTLLGLRREYPVLTRPERPEGRLTSEGIADVAWFDDAGGPVADNTWHDLNERVMQMVQIPEPGNGHTMLLVVQGSRDEQEVVLPGRPWSSGWTLLWDSAQVAAQTFDPETVPVYGYETARARITVPPISVRLYRGDTRR